MAQSSDDLEIVAKCSGYRQWQIEAQMCNGVELLTVINFLSNFQQFFVAGVS
jgi:hypothetical protein